MPTIEMKYGDYTYRPAPMINLAKQEQRSEDNSLNGVSFIMGLNGFLTQTTTGGISSLISLQNDLRLGTNQQGRLFTLTCDGNPLISGYPRISQAVQFSESNNNWVFTTPYTMELVFDEFLIYSGDTTGIAPPYISDLTESWALEINEDSAYYNISLPSGGADINPYQVRLTHSVSAVGKPHYTPTGLARPSWQQAQQAVVAKLGLNQSFAQSFNSGVLNLSITGFGAFNHVRTNELDVRGGTFSSSESWLLLNTGGAGNAVEDFTVNVANSVDNAALTSVSVEGTIQGLEVRSYGTNPGDFSVSTSKYAAASGYWANIQSKLYGRAQVVSNGLADRSINVFPLTKNVGHSFGKGTINYSYQYDDRISNCLTGLNILSENITINDNNKTDVFASIFVLGRNNPILQDLEASGQASREISIEIATKPVTGCYNTASGIRLSMAQSPKPQVDVIVEAFRQELIAGNSQVFISQDNESWSPKNGRYSRSIGFVYDSLCSS